MQLPNLKDELTRTVVTGQEAARLETIEWPSFEHGSLRHWHQMVSRYTGEYVCKSMFTEEELERATKKLRYY